MPAKIDYDQNWGKFSLAYNWKYPDTLDIADLVSGGKIIVQEPQNVDFLFPVLLDQKVKQGARCVCMPNELCHSICMFSWRNI